ncbi:MAG: hypothetical protein ABIU29_04420, partial [Chthoniobacterales bacterium]
GFSFAAAAIAAARDTWVSAVLPGSPTPGYNEVVTEVEDTAMKDRCTPVPSRGKKTHLPIRIRH